MTKSLIFSSNDKPETVPPAYIYKFMEDYKDQLQTIYNTDGSDKEGFLFLDCSISDNKVDASFLTKDKLTNIIPEDERSWERIKSDGGDNKIYIFRDVSLDHTIFIIYV